jgi:phage terminase small subunit
MPVLKNPKHELFAQEVAKGVTLETAYALAGYAPSRKNAQRLRSNEGVSRRVEEILSRAAEKTGVSIEKVLSELAKIGFSDIRKAVKWRSSPSADQDALSCSSRNPASNIVEIISSDEIDDVTAAAIAEISQNEKGSLKIKLHDKRAALVDLGRHLGMFKEKVEVTGKDGGPIETEKTIVILPANGRD